MQISFDKYWQRLQDRYLLNHYVKPFVKRNERRVCNEDNTIILFCQPRSGSTWLSEILLSSANSCLIDEPLWRGGLPHVFQIPDSKMRKIQKVVDLNFYTFQPILMHEEWEEARVLIQDIVCGRIPIVGLYKEQGLTRLKKASNYIIKFNHAQLMIHWILKYVSAKAIILVRHPCAVVKSQLELRSFFNYDPNVTFTSPAFRNSSLFQQYESIYSTFKSKEEWLAFFWSIQIKHSIYQPHNQNKYLVVAYESLVTGFFFELDRIFKYINYSIPSNIQGLQLRPSKSTNKTTRDYLDKNTQIAQWQHSLPERQINNILAVVEKMEIDIYNTTPEPDYYKLYGNAASSRLE